MELDRHSPTWKVIEKWALAQRDTVVQRLSSPKTDHPETQYLRGRLKQLDTLLALQHGSQPIASTPVDYTSPAQRVD